jgi:uncharacterized surface protein with fasciclin (FAS1) repeats
MMKKRYYKYISIVLLGLFGIVFSKCDIVPEEVEISDEYKQIMEYIEDDSLNYGQFFEISEKVGLTGILSTRGPFTLFLPNDSAFYDYYALKGKNSYNDFTDDELIILLRNHVVPSEITTSDIGLGSLNERNAIGDYLVSEFRVSDIVINKNSSIIKRDIMVANGVIHKIDQVIDPVTEGSYSTLNKLDDFSIFTEALELAGLSDTLDKVEIPYGLGTARVRYTILAVSDSVYQENGINTVQDLVAEFDDGVGSLTDLDNGFYKYMVYHCLENTYYLSTFEEDIYYVISRENYVFIEYADIFSINPNAEDSIVTTFIDYQSNIPAKNGVIHGITQIMPSKDPEKKEYNFDTTAFPEFMKMDIYEEGGVTNFYDGENGFANIKWTGDYLQYWKKFQGTGFINDDCIIMSDGYWTLDITLPRIARGKYNVYGYFKTGTNRANVVFYIDGKKTENIIELNGPQSYVTEFITQVNWEKTENHLVTVKTVYPGIIMWDRLTFIPPEIDENN